MNWSHKRARFITVLVFAVAAQAAAEVTLNQVTFPEKRSVDLTFAATSRAPAARVEATVKHREGQAVISLKFRDMKPAILYGGDVTSYVLWAVSREGGFENLGELWVRTADDELEFSTGMKSFALMVTAEAYPLVNAPCDLVIFTSQPSEDKQAPNTPFAFSEFAPAPVSGMPTIANITWDSSKPLDLLQAEKAFELAEREGAAEHVPQIYHEAKIALGQAQAYGTHTTRTKSILDFSRRAVSLSSEAIAGSIRRKEAIELEQQIEERRREMDAIQAKARSAEEEARAAQGQLQQTETALAEVRLAKDTADARMMETRKEMERLQLDAQAQRQAAEVAAAQAQQELTRVQTEAQAQRQAAEVAAVQAQQELARVQAEAQAQRQVAEASLTETRQKLEQAQAEAAGQQAAAAAAMAKAREDLDRLESQRAALEQQQAGLQASVAELGAEAEKLRAEREQLASRLQGALSKVAETQSSARGLIVSLPDILFATNEATLKPEAREAIAKLSGILLIMPELNLRIEGHTDATGGDEYNQRLSEKRAASVRDFLVSNSIDMGRIVAAGYGKTRPRADNGTAEGRQKNRRVEIVIAQGEVQEAAAPTP